MRGGGGSRGCARPPVAVCVLRRAACRAPRSSRAHSGVVARFGDKLWDVAHVDSLDTYLQHVGDRDCYLFVDPRLKGTLSAKLPGV